MTTRYLAGLRPAQLIFSTPGLDPGAHLGHGYATTTAEIIIRKLVFALFGRLFLA